MQYFFKYVLAYFLHLNNYLVTFLHNPICGAQLICPSVSFGISFEHAVQLPITVLLYSTFPDNYAFLSLSPSQIKNTHSADTVPVHGHSTLVLTFIVKRSINGMRKMFLKHSITNGFRTHHFLSFDKRFLSNVCKTLKCLLGRSF